MSKTTVSVAYVNPPREGKKLYNIKTDDNRVFYFDQNEHTFKKGGIYEIEYDSSEYPKGSGKMYHRVKSVTAARTNGANGARGGNGNTDDRIHWESCIKSAASVHSGTGLASDMLIEYARELYAAQPEAEEAHDDPRSDESDW